MREYSRTFVLLGGRLGAAPLGWEEVLEDRSHVLAPRTHASRVVPGNKGVFRERQDGEGGSDVQKYQAAGKPGATGR